MKNQPLDRRPITARGNPLARQLAQRLAQSGVTPNAISVASFGFAVLAGLCLAATAYSDNLLLWWGAAVFMLLRLLANMLDGMVAVEGGKASSLGELFNELPDRVSDAVIFVAAGYATGSLAWLGYLAAILALLVAYLRALGNQMGVKQLFQGPMSKSQRMFTLIAACLYQGTLAALLPIPMLLAWTLAVISAGSLLTLTRRLARIVAEVQP